MTKDEIKSSVTMRDILAGYNLFPSRSGFISCPFHQGDRDASLKVYEKDYHCFACGAHGDVFTFVQEMDGLTFSEAFTVLGGTYEQDNYKSKLAIYKADKKRATARKRMEKEHRNRQLNNALIDIYMRYTEQSEPLSQVWCDCYNALQYQIYINEILNEPR